MKQSHERAHKKLINPLLVLGSCVLMSPCLTGFVLLGKQEAKLPVSVSDPSIEFFWSTTGNAPSLTEKEKYKNGAYAGMSDEELTPILIQEAMDQWNQIRGSYLRLVLQTTASELSTQKDDKVNNIVVLKTNNASEAAHASPNVDRATDIIIDCDITINDVKTTALSFLETVTHELGHCVGLGHPHSNYGAIMSYSRGGRSYRLSADDKAGTIFLYPDPNYVSDEPNELIGCGTISGEKQRANASRFYGLFIWLCLSLPILLQGAKKLKSALAKISAID